MLATQLRPMTSEFGRDCIKYVLCSCARYFTLIVPLSTDPSWMRCGMGTTPTVLVRSVGTLPDFHPSPYKCHSPLLIFLIFFLQMFHLRLSTRYCFSLPLQQKLLFNCCCDSVALRSSRYPDPNELLSSFDDIFFFTQLMDYKSSVNKATSVLAYLTRVIITKFPHIAALEDDLKHVEKASQGQYK